MARQALVNSVPLRPHAGGYCPASENGAATQWGWAFLGLGGAAALLVFDTRAWDALITGVLQSVPSWLLLRAAEAVTMFGSVQLTGALVLWGAWAAGRRYGARTACWLILPFLACFPLELLLKMLGPHIRPSAALAPGGVVWAWFRVPPTVSFPSGHMLRLTYLVGMLLAWEAFRTRSPRRPVSRPVSAMVTGSGMKWSIELAAGTSSACSCSVMFPTPDLRAKVLL